ncbi:MAG: prepilin-type N-terminal cleavage/methylation domain-containing protein [Candidatus Curtissbacteria bacterium]
MHQLLTSSKKSKNHKLRKTKISPVKTASGFTLIELLVVISIIGILSALAVVSFSGAQARARDGQRKSDLKAISTALQLYYNDNGQYPTETWCDSSIGSAGSACPISPPQSGWSTTSGIYKLQTLGLIKRLPVDPKNNSTYYYDYEPNSPGQGSCTANICEYYLRTRLESNNIWYYVYSP